MILPNVVKHNIIGFVKLQLRKTEIKIKVTKLNKTPICGLNIKAIRSTVRLKGMISEDITKILFIRIVRIIDIIIQLRIITVLGIEENGLGKNRTSM